MKVLLLILLISLTAIAKEYPTLYSQLGTPLYKADVKLQILTKYETLQKNILSYSSLSKKTLKVGQIAELTGDKAQKKAYLNKLRKLQKSYDGLSVFLQKQLILSMKKDDYLLFLSMINTEANLFLRKPKSKEKIYRYYKTHKSKGISLYLNTCIAKDERTVVQYNTSTPNIQTYHDKSRHTQVKSSNNSVTILSTPSCSYCRKAKSFLRGNHVTFTDYNINTSSEGKRLYRKYNGNGVPIVIINGRVIKGYSESAMRSALR